MIYHDWSDTTFDWKSLDSACKYLEKNCKRWSRLGIHTKEKYGTMRVSTTVAWFTEHDFIHHFFYPGYCRYVWPRWFRKYVDWPVGKLMSILGVVNVIQWYQTKVLKFFWLRTAKKWPHIKNEIMDGYIL